ncbi:hypothetical protein TM7_0328 [candidate division TM7 genomosp. GTL1]|nr:hypothetical protein TM7_0328 [candidate division TM7 genomosp. GTL1]
MKVTLPGELWSDTQLGWAIVELREYAAKLRDRAARRQVASTVGEEMPPLSPLGVKILQANNVTLAKAEEIEALVRELETIRGQAPTTRLILADVPDDLVRSQIVGWFRQSVHPYVLVTFIARADIGGGMILQAGSKHYDFSYKKRLLENKAKLPEILARAQ